MAPLEHVRWTHVNKESSKYVIGTSDGLMILLAGTYRISWNVYSVVPARRKTVPVFQVFAVPNVVDCKITTAAAVFASSAHHRPRSDTTSIATRTTDSLPPVFPIALPSVEVAAPTCSSPCDCTKCREKSSWKPGQKSVPRPFRIPIPASGAAITRHNPDTGFEIIFEVAAEHTLQLVNVGTGPARFQSHGEDIVSAQMQVQLYDAKDKNVC